MACVEVKSKEQKQILISKANIIFPGCTAKTPSSPFESLIIVKHFNSLISTEDTKKDFKRTYQTSCSLCRFHSNSNKKPLPIISIKTNKTLTQTLIEAYKQPVVCCFNCQRFGHWINNCLLESAFENCGKPLHNHPH